MSKIIMSYRRSDSQAVSGRIVDRLIAHFGDKSVFMDIDNIPFGTDFRHHIKTALSHADVLLAIVGPDWLGIGADGRSRLQEANDPVRVEIEAALAEKLHVIPVLVNGATMPDAADLPGSLKDFAFLNAAPVDAGRDFHPHVDRLIKAIDEVVPHKSEQLLEVPAVATTVSKPLRSRGLLIAVAAVLLLVAGIAAWQLQPRPLPIAAAPEPAPPGATASATPPSSPASGLATNPQPAPPGSSTNPSSGPTQPTTAPPAAPAATAPSQDPPGVAQTTAPPETVDVHRFDGMWAGSDECKKTPSGLPGWKKEIVGQIKDGVFHVQRGTPGTPASETFDGKVNLDGTAEILHSGLTGNPAKDPFHRPSGTSFHNTYAGRFDSSHGSFIRTDRASCTIDLAKTDTQPKDQTAGKTN
jgi:TIR domain